jgi:hypothetical protein
MYGDQFNNSICCDYGTETMKSKLIAVYFWDPSYQADPGPDEDPVEYRTNRLILGSLEVF